MIANACRKNEKNFHIFSLKTIIDPKKMNIAEMTICFFKEKANLRT
jgi:hypothetical protein